MIPSHDLEIIQNQKIVVVKLDTLQSYDFGVPHRHEYFELFYFDKGEGTHMIDFEDLPIGSKEVQMVGPGQVHQVMREKDTNGYVILFHQNVFENESLISDFLFDAICSDASSNPFIFDFSDSEIIPFCFANIWNLRENESVADLLQTKMFLAQILTECLKKNDKAETRLNSEYLSFRKSLRTNFKKLHKVQDYASLIGCTDKTLNELTKKYTGKKASQLIYDHIILEAKRVLLMGSSVKESAFELGFDDPAHFSKFFKSKTGVSPKEFQNVHV